jgi:peptide/nickel transport system substrate-binding protein
VGPSPAGIVVGDDAVWVAESDAGLVARLDPRSARLDDEIHVGSGPSALALEAGGVWVANELDSTVSLIDTRRNVVTLTRSVAGTPGALAAVGRRVWVAARDIPSLTQLDQTGTGRTVRLASPATVLAPLGSGVLAALRGVGVDHRGGTLVVRTSFPLIRIEPYYCCDTPENMRALSYGSLLALSKSPGTIGRLVPNLALAVPRPEAGGRVYTFRLRPGIRYWTGSVVRASDIRRGLERAARSGILASYLSALPGATACPYSSRPCDLSRAVVTDDRTGTITLHLARPDPELPFALTLTNFAPSPSMRGLPPGTGPYRIARFVKRRLVDFKRNRYFTTVAPAAQPLAKPDRILWQMGAPPADNVAAVLRGDADYTSDAPTPRQRADILLHAPGQLHTIPAPATSFMALNTRTAPFNDVRVRRALNFAVDRRAIARYYGGQGSATPICQIVPAGISGHRGYCPYTQAPSRSGRWTAPDLARARKLIAASGTRGMTVTIWGEVGSDGAMARYYGRLLHRLGFRPRVHVAPHPRWVKAIMNYRHPPQMITQGWGADYPSASQWINLQLSCRTWNPPTRLSNHSEYCDPVVDGWADAAARLQATDTLQAARLWARADRRLTDAAPWVVNLQWANSDLISRRVRNFRYAPTFGTLVDQLWVK